MNGWQTMESAPKDKLVDLWVVSMGSAVETGRRCINCIYSKERQSWFIGGNSRTVEITQREAVFWMLTPEPPFKTIGVN